MNYVRELIREEQTTYVRFFPNNLYFQLRQPEQEDDAIFNRVEDPCPIKPVVNLERGFREIKCNGTES